MNVAAGRYDQMQLALLASTAPRRPIVAGLGYQGGYDGYQGGYDGAAYPAYPPAPPAPPAPPSRY